MKEQIQKKINDSKALRWGVLVLVAFTMLCGYFLTDAVSYTHLFRVWAI